MLLKIIFVFLFIAVMLFVGVLLSGKQLKFKDETLDLTFKRIIGALIICFVIFVSVRYVKMFPAFLKIGVIALDITAVYLVIKFLFINRNNKNNKTN